jgi:hypothetical protein
MRNSPSLSGSVATRTRVSHSLNALGSIGSIVAALVIAAGAAPALAGPTKLARTIPAATDPVMSFKDGRVLFADGVILSLDGSVASGGDPLDLGPMAACFAEDSSPTLAELRRVNEIIADSGYGSRYNRSDRWGSTVIGSVGSAGDPITITWSFIPDGVALNDGFGNDTSSLFADMDAKFGGNRATWIAQFTNSFARISALTGIDYVRVTSGGNEWDDGAAWGTGGGANGTLRGMVRIGMKQVDNASNILAYNQFPDNGDMILDEDENWGSSTSTYRFLRNTIMHEHGHGLGFSHICAPDSSALMEPFLSTSFDGPQQDELRGFQHNYGDPAESNDSQATAFLLGTPPVGTSTTYGSVPSPAPGNSALYSLNPGASNASTTDNDIDWYRINITGQRLVDITVRPIGSNYADYDQNQDGSCQTGAANMNALQQADLQLQVNNGTLAQVLRTQNATALGQAETISGILLNNGENTIRVSAANNLTNAQAYRIEVFVRTTNLAPSASDGTFTDRVRVSWPAGIPDATGFVVYRNTVNDLNTAVILSSTLPGTDVSYDDTTAVPGTTYFYFVRATQTGAIVQRALSTTGDAGFANIAPIANAGADQSLTLAQGQTTRAVTLNGAGSSDPDGSITTYAWSIGGTPVATGATPTINLAQGSYTVLLTVTDNRGATSTDTVQITINAAANQLPVAEAGPDQNLTLTPLVPTIAVNLNGTASTDPDGTISSYAWSIAGSQVATGATPTINLAQGVYTVTLVVTDNVGATDDDTVQITVNQAPNLLPTAEAGADQTVELAQGASTAPVTVSGAASTDPDGTIVSFTWSVDGVPAATGVNPTLSLAEGPHVVTLVVTDNRGGTDDDTLNVTVLPPSNIAPVANAGPDASGVIAGDDIDTSVPLDGTLSSDADGTIVSYVWTLNLQQIATGAQPTVSLAEGVQTITLTVTDNGGLTATDEVTITVVRTCDYDYNQDENVDLTDAQLMAQAAAGLITPEPNWLTGDLNRDENVDLTDAQLLATYVASGLCPF